MKDRKHKRIVGMGLAGTLLAGLLSTAWAEQLPDLTLPPTVWKAKTASAHLQAPPVPLPVHEKTDRDLVPAVPVPLADSEYPPVAVDSAQEPPALDEVETGVDPFQAEIGAPREEQTNKLRRPNTIQAVPLIARDLAARGLCPGRIAYTPRDVPFGGQVFHAVAVRP